MERNQIKIILVRYPPMARLYDYSLFVKSYCHDVPYILDNQLLQQIWSLGALIFLLYISLPTTYFDSYPGSRSRWRYLVLQCNLRFSLRTLYPARNHLHMWQTLAGPQPILRFHSEPCGDQRPDPGTHGWLKKHCIY